MAKTTAIVVGSRYPHRGTQMQTTQPGVHDTSEIVELVKQSVAGNAGRGTALIAVTIAKELMDKVTRSHAKNDKRHTPRTAVKEKVETMVEMITTKVERAMMVVGMEVAKEDGIQTGIQAPAQVEMVAGSPEELKEKAGIGTKRAGIRPKRQTRSLKRRTQD